MFRMIPEGAAYREHVLLKDGQGVLLRVRLRPPTSRCVEAFTRRVSRESLRMRFMASVSEVSRAHDRGAVLRRLHASVAACSPSSSTTAARSVVGLGNYVATGDGRTAEVAFLVEDAFQGRGISTLILERLAGIAAANGYVELRRRGPAREPAR